MLGTTFYNESIRKALVSFGTLFNDISLKRANTDGTIQTVNIPLAYAPRARFLQVLGQLRTGAETQYTLPRMSFEWTALTYDATRKLNTMQKCSDIVTKLTGFFKVYLFWFDSMSQSKFQMFLLVKYTLKAFKIIFTMLVPQLHHL